MSDLFRAVRNAGAARGGRIATLHYLRGFAALIVMYYHYVPWLMRYSQQGLERSIGKNLCGSVVSTTTRSDLQFYNIPYSGDFGSFGVGVFFLITGFVIPASVDRHTVRSFLHNRLLRLYPCYFVTMVAFAILLPLTAWRLCGHWDSVTLRHLLPNLAFLGTTINPVTWTLDVEVAFVVVTAIMISLGGFNAVRTFLLGGVCLMLTHAGGRLATVQGYEHLARNVTFLAADILYILGGTVCFLIYGRKIGPVAACGAIVGFAVAIHSGDNVIEQASVAFRSMNLSLTGLLTAKWSAFACFSMFLAAGPYWKRHCPFLERLGDISYPLYLVHMLLGLIIFEWLATVTDSGHIALWTAVSASLCCAVIMHFGVEKPLYRAGRHRGPSVGTSTVTPTL